ncbi:DNA topoisomerase 1 [Caerostris darwini]|uniref:DNA topoisomerase 1 n=1 Tax=Caerostris darwini TaxID=1538125 RepID=A0AAV4UJ50_9ARAC|nr:DNA topoisomerase 1 [Caerostris darwini]
MRLSDEAEEKAGFYGRMLDNEYTSQPLFQENFFNDWRAVMTDKEKRVIKDFKKCNFQEFDIYYNVKVGQRVLSTEEKLQEKLRLKRQKQDLIEKYGYCMIDGHKQKISNFELEPPGLFVGLRDHPKMGKLRKRIEAEDVVINIGKETKVPPPPLGHMWKEVRHDNTVSWLAKWTESIFSSTKYMKINPSYKGEKDCQKFEIARKLKAHVGRIRDQYTQDFKSDDMQVRQRAVALYFIDKLAFSVGNEEEDTADTVGCCSLRVKHISLKEVKGRLKWVVNFDFLGKDSIRYKNSVAVVEEVFNNLKEFMEGKEPGIDLFDKLNTSFLNKYLNDLMEGLTAKVFRTYNSSQTLEDELTRLTKYRMSVAQKVSVYYRAKVNAARLCNHQGTFSESFNKSMDTLETKMNGLKLQISALEKEVEAAKKGRIKVPEQRKKQQQLAQLQQQKLKELTRQIDAKQEIKQNSEETSELTYLDPRITVAWCKKMNVPFEEIYNISQRDEFKWAIAMAPRDFWF